MKLKWLTGAAAILWLGSAAPAGEDPTPLIPREVFFGNPDRASLQLSPDGKRLGFLAPVEGVLNVWVGPADDLSAARPVTRDANRGIRNYFWAYTNEHILYVQDKGGDENWRAYGVDVNTKKEIDLTPFENVQARIEQVSHKFPEEILIGLNNRDPRLHDLHRVNILTGRLQLVLENKDNYAGFVTDDDYRPRLALKMTPDGGSELYRFKGDQWESFTQVPAADNLTTAPAGLNKENTHVYMIDSRGRDTAALTRVNLEDRKSELIAQDPKADVSDVFAHPIEREIQAVASTYDRVRWQVLDESVKGDFEALDKVADGDFHVTSRTRDDRRWTVAYVMDDGPVRYYLYDRETKKAKFLCTNRASLENVKLSKMRPVILQSRDGLNLVSYVTLPVWTDTDGDGRPSRPLPMVLFVHGGPWARDDWGYNPYHQWLANRGYAVLSVNYRGSTGLGKNFINAANLEWSGKMHDDLIDAVDWAVREKIADPNKVAIMGGSYGGYATLVGLTYTPTKFACGVDIVGPSSLVTLLESIPPYWAPLIDMFTTRVGDHRTEDGRELLEKCSPLHRVDQICRPLLIGQGANDPRVKQAESDQIVSAMQKKNIPVTYALFPDEGHGFARPVNRMAFNALAEVFLSRHLGGRHEPLNTDLNDSTLRVPSGVDQIPGLQAVLQTKKSSDDM